MRRIAIVLAVAAALALAGCLGGGGDAAETTSSDATGPDGGQGSGPDATDETNETEEATLSWSNETRDGSFNGAYAGAQGQGIAVLGASENVTVGESVKNLTVHLTSETELLADVYPPCEDEGVAGTGFLADCESHSLDTENGSATWGTDDPEAGSWTVTIFRGENGAGEVSYSLTVARLLPETG